MTTVRELIEELQACADPDAKVVIHTREEDLGSLDGFGIGLYMIGPDDVASSEPKGTIVLRETCG